MGAAVTIELAKPADASDIISTGSLEYAKNEILRLRNDLGHLAQSYGMQVMPNNADDLIFGDDENGDFERVVAEIVHIRACLRLNTQSSKRRSRYVSDTTTCDEKSEALRDGESKYESDSDSSESSVGDDAKSDS